MSELALGLYVGAVTNLAIAAVLNNNAVWQPDAAAWLVVLGAWNEVLGLAFVASPELWPRVVLAGRWLRRQPRLWRDRIGSLVRLLLGTRSDVVVHAGGAVAGGIALGGSASASVGPPDGASVEVLVAWLVRRDRESQARIDHIEQEIRGLPARWTADLHATKDRLERRQDELVRGLADARIRLRLSGLGYVLLGVILSGAGNLV